MPRQELGYIAPHTQDATRDALLKLQGGEVQPMGYWQYSHNVPLVEATRPGITPLALAVRDASTLASPFTAIAISEHQDPSDLSLAFMKDRYGRVVTLNQLLKALPQFAAAKSSDPLLQNMPTEELMRRHADTVHLYSFLNSHDIALRESLRRLGIEDPDTFLGELLDEKTLRAAAFVDAAIGSWLLAQRGRFDIVDRDDWPPGMVTRTLDGQTVRADIGNNHGLVPSLEGILSMHPQLRQHQLALFENMVRFNDVIALHTRRDIANLTDIADYLHIPPEERGTMHIRNLMPPSFVSFEGKEPDPEKVAPFIKDAVSKGRIIAGVVERLDIFKMDPTFLDNMEYMIRTLSETESGNTMLRNLRIAIIARPLNFSEEWAMSKIYGPYNDYVERKINFLNNTFREIMHMDEDFVLAHRDANGRLTGYPHNNLKAEFYPHLNVVFQLGQEGLCQTVQEGMLTTAFGLPKPRPAVAVISNWIGFAEKARENGLSNVIIVDDPRDPHQVTDAFVRASTNAASIKAHPQSPEVHEILKEMETYYDKCGDSFYADLLNALIEKRRSNDNT